MTINDLPSYLSCQDCGRKHYLSLNKDIHGNWTMAYIEFKDNTAILALNNSSSLSEAVQRMHYALERHNKASGKTVT